MTAASTVWQSEVRYFTNLKQGPHTRGLIDYLPKKAFREKLIANLARHLLADATEPPEHLLVFAPGDRLHAALIKQLLPEIYHLEICADGEDDLISLFGQPDGSYIAVSLCLNSSKIATNLNDAAKSLNMFLPDLSLTTTQHLEARLEQHEQRLSENGTTDILRTLVIQEGANRFTITDADLRSLRTVQRLVHLHAQAKNPGQIKTTFEAPLGGGYQALSFDLHKEAPNAAKRAAAMRLRFNTQTYSFDNLPLVVFAAINWLEELAGLKINQLRKLKIMAPYAPVAAQILRLFEQEEKITLSADVADLDQFIFGWQSNLALTDVLMHGDGPALLLQVDQFPQVDMVLSW